MPIESIADREDILAAVRAYNPSLPETLIGRWGVFLGEQLIEIRGYWTFASRGRANTKRRQLIENRVRLGPYNSEQRQYNTLYVFGRQINLRIPIQSGSENYWRHSIQNTDTDLIDEILDLFEVRQIGIDEARVHCEQLQRIEN
jgi:hypothetical protein